MTDRELLELAAKAAGYDVVFVHDNKIPMRRDVPNRKGMKVWNPLEDDGDALRLAVMLNLLIDSCGMAARPLDDNIGWIDGDGETACQRVRSAITKVAAEIGRNMP